MFKSTLQKFKSSPPGSRFHTMYADHRKAAKAAWVRVAWVGVGVLVLIVGIIALPAPGPGMPIVALGLALIARESEKLANALDRFEVYVRGKWNKMQSTA